MTKSEFNSECLKRTIPPALALEDDEIAAALRERDDNKVRQLLDENF
jgi:hypothetical protein